MGMDWKQSDKQHFISNWFLEFSNGIHGFFFFFFKRVSMVKLLWKNISDSFLFKQTALSQLI